MKGSHLATGNDRANRNATKTVQDKSTQEKYVERHGAKAVTPNLVRSGHVLLLRISKANVDRHCI